MYYRFSLKRNRELRKMVTERTVDDDFFFAAYVYLQ